MKINLAENMLRFGAKNLTEASKQKLNRLAEQEITKPTTKPTPNVAASPGTTDASPPKLPAVELDPQSLPALYNTTTQEYISSVYMTVKPAANNNYVIDNLVFQKNDKTSTDILKFSKPLTFQVPITNTTSEKIEAFWMKEVAARVNPSDVGSILVKHGRVGTERTTGAGGSGTTANNADITSFVSTLGAQMWQAIEPQLIQKKLFIA